jgi:hypothetical protein
MISSATGEALMADGVGEVLAGIATVGDMTAAFQDEDRCRRLLETMIWPRGRICPACGYTRSISLAGRDLGRRARPGLYQCSNGECRFQFTVTTRTPLHSTKLPPRMWISEPQLRRETGQELNKGEARNSLARAVFIHRLGEIRDRTYENQQHRASGLNLLVTAVILWNTRYLERAAANLRQAEYVPDNLLAHLSPLGWEHVNLTGDYVWGTSSSVSENPAGMRPLRPVPELHARAA